jgi:uncharacterized protein (TIGR00369 family)
LGFRDLVGLEVEPVADGVARVTLDADDRHLNPLGTVHGGVIAALVDTAMGEAVVTTTGGERPATIDMTVAYLEPGRPGRLVATAEVRKSGRRVTIVEADVTQPDPDGDEAVAHAVATFTTPA